MDPTRSSSTRASRPQGLFARSPALGLGLTLLGGAAFAILAHQLRTDGPLVRWDVPICTRLHARARRDGWLVVQGMRFVSSFGREIPAAIQVVLSLHLLATRRWRELLMLTLAITGGNTWFVVLSQRFGRARPSFPDPLALAVPGPGFPSGHSMTAVLLYGLMLYWQLPTIASLRLRLLAAIDTVLFVLLIGYSRVYVGDHYPTDVLAGYAFGLAWGASTMTCVELGTRLLARVRVVTSRYP